MELLMHLPPALIPWSPQFDEIWSDMPPPMPPPMPPNQEAMMAVNLDDIFPFTREGVHKQAVHAVQKQRERPKRYPDIPKRNGRIAMKSAQPGKYGIKDDLVLESAERRVEKVNRNRPDGVGGYKMDSDQVNGVCQICPFCHTRHAIHPDFLRATPFQSMGELGISFDRLGHHTTPLHVMDRVPVHHICHHFAAPPSPSLPSPVVVDITPKSKPASRTHPKKKKSKSETPIYEYRKVRVRKDERARREDDKTSIPRIQDNEPPVTSMPSRTQTPSSSSSSLSGKSSIRSQGKEKSYNRAHFTIPPSAPRSRTNRALDEDNRSTASVDSDSTKLGIIPPDKLAVPYDISRTSGTRRHTASECRTQQPVSKPKKKRGFFT